METNRFFEVMLMELTSNVLKIEDNLERTMHSDLNINDKIKLFNELLHDYAIAEISLKKFNFMVGKDLEKK